MREIEYLKNGWGLVRDENDSITNLLVNIIDTTIPEIYFPMRYNLTISRMTDIIDCEDAVFNGTWLALVSISRVISHIRGSRRFGSVLVDQDMVYLISGIRLLPCHLYSENEQGCYYAVPDRSYGTFGKLGVFSKVNNNLPLIEDMLDTGLMDILSRQCYEKDFWIAFDKLISLCQEHEEHYILAKLLDFKNSKGYFRQTDVTEEDLL